MPPDGSADVERVLEPSGRPAGKTYPRALFDDGIPATPFASADIQSGCERLAVLGVAFRARPTKLGPVTLALFEDTCGT